MLGKLKVWSFAWGRATNGYDSRSCFLASNGVGDAESLDFAWGPMPGELKVSTFAWGPMPGALKVSIFAWGRMPGKLKVLGAPKSRWAPQARKRPVLVLKLGLGSSKKAPVRSGLESGQL